MVFKFEIELTNAGTIDLYVEIDDNHNILPGIHGCQMTNGITKCIPLQ